MLIVSFAVLIVAKCIVNRIELYAGYREKKVLIVAKCIVNMTWGEVWIKAGKY